MELDYLIYSLILAWVMILTSSMIHGRGYTPGGMWLLMQNRENMPEETPLGGRAKRAAWNMVENLLLFSILVLVAAVQNISTENTALGAALFFWARLVYFPLYLIGIPVVRTIAWAVAVIGMILIAVEILQA